MNCLRIVTIILGIGLVTAPARGGETIHGMHTTTADIDRLEAWQKWIDKPVAIVGENLWAASWEGLTGNNPHTGVGLTLAAWRKAFSNPRSGIDPDVVTLNLGVPMFPISPVEGGTPYQKIPERWEAGAAGEFNDYFHRLSRTLVREGLGRSYLRLAWEFNVPTHWNNYAIRDNPQWWPLFVEYWRQIHRSMTSVPGAEFRWIWCVSCGSDTKAMVPTRDAWPGDDYVDVVGVDFYDGYDAYYAATYQEANPPFDRATVGRWLWDFLASGIERDTVTGEILRRDLPCLDSYHAFAKARGKGFGIDEWGVVQSGRFPTSWGSGGNDRPEFIESVHQWISNRDVDYALYFEYFIATDDHGFVDHSILPGYWCLPGTEEKFIHPHHNAHPASSARYLELFHGKRDAAPSGPIPDPPVIEETFASEIPESWSRAGGWRWRRGALFIENAPADSLAAREIPPLRNGSIAFEIASPESINPVASHIGPYSIELTGNRHGNLDRVRLLLRESGSELATARPKFPHVIGKMYLPVRVEIRRLGSGLQTLTLFAGQEKLLHHLDLEPSRDPVREIGFSAGEGNTVYLDNLVIRSLPE